MSMQNGSYLEVSRSGILIHTLELRFKAFEVSPYVCIVNVAGGSNFYPGESLVALVSCAGSFHGREA